MPSNSAIQVNQRLEVGQVEERFLRFEITGNDQQMIVDDIELVEQSQMRVRDIRDKEIRLVGKEWIHRWALPSMKLSRLPALLLLADQARDLPHDKTDAAAFDHRLEGFDLLQRAAAQRVPGLAQHGRPQGSR